ncbi:MAG: orotidine-5'-phosphate decarboxylase [Nitrospinota bacterium]
MKKQLNPANKLIVALDVPTAADAMRWVSRLTKCGVTTFKVGSELFTAAGPEIVKKINAQGGRVFLDLKYFDIPNTMAGAVRRAAKLKPFLINVHALAGPKALRECAKAVKKAGGGAKLIAVTILTSFDTAELEKVNIKTPTKKTVIKLARAALDCGLAGVVASPKETAQLRKMFGEKFLVVTPGVRPSWAAKNDQSRVATPLKAIRDGADFVVLGRPILSAKKPVDAVKIIIEEIESAGR